MKKISGFKAIMSFVAGMFMAAFIGGMSQLTLGWNPTAVASTLMSAQLGVGIYNAVKETNVSGIVMNAIQQELWVNYIIGNLFKDNQFMNYCFDESASVLAGSVVHIPQAGAKPTVVKNRSTFPASVVHRSDTDITYVLDVYTTDPTLITNAESHEISYDKIGSVISEHADSLAEAYADDLLFKWAPTVSDNIIFTTGTAAATALAPSATGTRLAFVKADLKRAQKLMNNQKIPKQDRVALFPTDLLSQLQDDADLLKRDGVQGGEMNLKDGVIMRLYGFDIMERSDTTLYDNSNAPKAPTAAGASTDNMAVICWQKNAVAKAMGDKKFYELIGNPQMYGDTYSAEIKLGGRKRRESGHGVIAIVQAAS